jgi:carboxypeptidase Q
VKKIPTACVTIEDAEMMGRMAARGTKITINLKMEAKNLPYVTSRNTVAEIVGSKYPEQVNKKGMYHIKAMDLLDNQDLLDNKGL